MKTRYLIMYAMAVLGGLSCNQKETKEYIPLINPASTENILCIALQIYLQYGNKQDP